MSASTLRPAAKRRLHYEVPGFSRGLRLVELLCASEQPLGVSDISQRLGFNKHMVFRLLHTLLECGWIVAEEDGPKYRMSLVPFHHTSKPVARLDLFKAAEAPLQVLWEDIGEAVYLGVLDQDMVLYLMHRDGTRDVRLGGRVGMRYWPHCGAPGKVLLAYGGPEVLDRVVARGLKRLTPATILSESRLRQEMALVRRQGYATDLEEYTTGGMCLAGPVFDYAGRLAAAVGTTVMTLHYTPEEMVAKLGPKVLAAARSVSLALGWRNEQEPHEKPQ